MRSRIVLPLLIVCAGCHRGDGLPQTNEMPGTSGESPSAAQQARLVTLTGRYESGSYGTKSVLCILRQRKGYRFGLVVRAPGNRICSGSGSLTRSGSGVRLRMTGDSSCAIVARISGPTIVFPQALPSGCAYYCGAEARMARARFTQVGGTVRSAYSARDLVGEPLCGGDES